MPLDQTLGATDPTYDPQSIVTGLIGQQDPSLVQGGTVDPQAVLNRLIRKGLARTSSASSQPTDFSAYGKTPQELGPNAAPNGETPDFASFGEPAQPDQSTQPNPQFTGGGKGTAESPYTGDVPAQGAEEGAAAGAAEAAVAAPIGMTGQALKYAARAAGPAADLENETMASMVGAPKPEPTPPPEESPLYKAGEATQQFAKSVGPSEATKQAHPIATGIGSGIGGAAGAIALGMADPIAGLAGSAALFGASSAEDTYEDAKEHGADDQTASGAALLSGTANAALGTLPIGNVLKPFEKIMPQAAGLGVNILAQAAQNGVVFSTVGEAQQYIGQEIAKMYDPKAGYSPDVERLISEFAAGAVLGGLHAGISGRGQSAESAAGAPQASENHQNPPDTQGLPPPNEASAGAATGPGPQPQPGTGGAGAQAEPPNAGSEAGAEAQNAAAGPAAEPEAPPAPFETQLNPKTRRLLEEKAGYYNEFSPEIIASWSDDKLKDYVNTKFGFGSQKADDDEILRRYGVPPADAAAMSPEQKSATVDEALRNGVHAGQAPPTQGTADNPVDLKTGDDVAAVASMASQAHTPAQGEAGNVQRGHATWNGLDISIEVPPGGVRRGAPPTGEPWETTHPHAYGEILGVPNAADGMRPDVIVGPNPQAPNAYVIDELDRSTGKYKQSKAFVGFDSADEARQSYLGISSKVPEQIAAIEAFPSAQFPDMVRKGLLSGPVAGKGSNADVSPKAESGAEQSSASSAPPTHADHQAIEDALRQVGVDPKHIRPVDIARAAEIHAQEGYSPEDSFQLAVARAGIEDGLLTPEQVEQNYGPEIRSLLVAPGASERGLRAPTYGTPAGGEASPGANERVPGGGANGAQGRGDEAEGAAPARRESVRPEERPSNAVAGSAGETSPAGHPEAGTADLHRTASGEHHAAGEREPARTQGADQREAAATPKNAGHLTVPESEATLRAQQQQLVDGRRPVQMFPVGSKELPLPDSMQRVVAPSGDVFHFNPKKISVKTILKASKGGNENRLLGLGPYNKADVAGRIARGEKPVVVAERMPDGTEVRAAAGTEQTAPVQMAAMERSKTPGNIVQVEHPMQAIKERRKAQSVGGQPFAGMLENEEKYRANAKKRRENGLGTGRVYKSAEAEWRRHGLTGEEAKAQHEAATIENTKKFDAAMGEAAIPRNSIPDDVYHAAVGYMHSLAFDPLEALDYAVLKAEHEAQFLESQEAYEAAQHVFEREESLDADVTSIPPEDERASARLGHENETRREATTGGEVGVSQRPTGAGPGSATAAGHESEPANGHEPDNTERTAAGEQHVIPGAERISDAELAKRTAEQPLKPKVAQKAADEGLFSDQSTQADLVDQARAAAREAEPPPKEPASAAKTEETKAPETGPSDSGVSKTTTASRRIEDFGEKIGGARKDLATAGESSRAAERPKDERPTWAKRFSVQETDVRSTEPGQNGKRWLIFDERTGKPLTDPAARWKPLTFASQEEAERVMPLAAVSLKHRVVSAPDGKFKIIRDVTDRKRVTIKGDFESRDEATRYLHDHAVDILETKTGYGEEILAAPEKVMRAGPTRRVSDATEKDFADTFGFRGVEFGNWNNQAERQEVMNHAYDGLRDLADLLNVPPRALSLDGDLAIAFGARGHGLSGARAHYERDYGVINLTKMSGAGSLAHEWMHALDAYLARLDTKAKSIKTKNARGDLVYDAGPPSSDFISHGSSARSELREEVRGALKELWNTISTKAEKYVEDSQQAEKWLGTARKRVTDALDAVRKDLAKKREYGTRFTAPANDEQLARFDALADKLRNADDIATTWRTSERGKGRYSNDTVDALSKLHKEVRGRTGFSENRGPLDNVVHAITDFRKRLQMMKEAAEKSEKTRRVPTQFSRDAYNLDQGRASDYWSTPHEMLARAMSAYAEDKIAVRGGKSEFLSYGSDNAFYRIFNARPFPEGAEREAIDKAFDKFFSTLKVIEGSKPGSLGLAEEGGSRFIAPTFYSAVARAVDGAKQEKASPNQWLGTLKNSPGVKPEEMQWLGLDQWLRDHKGPVTKAEIADYVRAHQLEVHEIEKGRVAPELKRAYGANERLIGKYGSLEDAFKRWTPEEQNEFDRVHAAAAGADEEPDDTKFQQYTLPGGENYRELLLTLPQEMRPTGRFVVTDGTPAFNMAANTRTEAQDIVDNMQRHSTRPLQIKEERSPDQDAIFKSSHWDEPNVLAHIRFDDRTTSDDGTSYTPPKRTLHIAEIQSDWHQAGRKKGYAGPPNPALTKKAQSIVDAKLMPQARFLRNYIRNGRFDLDQIAPRDIDHWQGEKIVTSDEAEKLREWFRARSDEVGVSSRVPDAPFKTTWPELSLKRMIRYAAENGYDRLTWDTGDTNAKRYDLSRALDRIEYSKEPDGRWHISPYAKDDPTAILAEGDVPRKFSSVEEIERVYGKDIAEKITNGVGAPPTRITRFNKDAKVFRGDDLRVGGEGMRGFYDKLLPAAANKLVKKFGTRVERTELNTYGEQPFTTVETDDGRFEVVDRRTAERVPDLPRYSTMEQAEHAADLRNYAAYNEGETDATAAVHSIDITETLRDAAVRQGFALFQPDQGPFSGRQHGVPSEARHPIFSHRSADDLKRHPDYLAAKAGDAAAAVRLVRDLVAPKQIEEAKARFGSDVTYVPVIAEERTGDNAIPAALAGRYAVETGANWTNEITQENHAYHTGAGAMERLANRATFEGNVEAGKRYVLVDDVSVMGSTLADLADHIQRGGGEVAGVVLLAHAGRSPILTPADRTLRDIEGRHGDAIRDLFGIHPASLTTDEAAYLRNFRNADELKARKAAAERERSVRLGTRGLLQERVAEPTEDKTQGAQSGAPFVSETLKQAKLGGSFRPTPGMRLGAQAQNYVLARGRATGNEHVVAIHRNGETALQAEGGESGIRFAPSEAALFANPKNDLVVHHNHPNNGAFSIQDLSMLGAPGLHALWAHGHAGHILRIAPTSRGRGVFQSADFERNIERMGRFARALGESQFVKPLTRLIEARRLEPKRADRLYLHLIAEALRRAGLVDYHTSGDFENDIASLGLNPHIDGAARAVIRSALNGYPDQRPLPGHDRRTGPVFEHPADLGAAFERDRIASAGYTRSPSPNRLRQRNDRARPQGPVGLAEDNGARTAAGGAGGNRPPPPPNHNQAPESIEPEPLGSLPPRPLTGSLAKVPLAKQFKNFWSSTFQPELFSDRALEADPQFARYKARQAQEKDAIIAQSEKNWHYWNKKTDAERFRFLDDIERGAVPANPNQAEMARNFRRMLDKNWEEEKRWGSQASFVEDYLPHIWERPEEFRAWSESRSAQVGPTWFQKKRTIDYISDGLAAGLKLKYTNPVDIVVHRLLSGVDMRQRMELLYRLKDMGLAWEGKQGGDQLVRRGWRAIVAPDRKQWVLAPDVQLLWKNAVEAKGLWQDEGLGGGVFRGWMTIKNAWVPIKLALSAFHPLHVLHIDQANTLALAWEHLAKGHDPVAALKTAAQGISTIPTLGYAHAKQGGKARAGYLKRPSQQTPDEKATNALMADGGFVPQLSEQMKVASKRSMAEAFAKIQRGEAGLPEWAKFTWAAARRPIEALQAPIFERWIPNLKTAAYLNQAAALLQRHPELLDDDVRRGIALRAIAKSIDNRYGEMNYGTLFWNRYTKDAAIGSFLSLGWNLGFLREFGGAAMETVSRPLGATPLFRPSEGRKIAREATNKIPNAVAYFTTAALILGAMTYLLAGKEPHGLDFIFPRIGGQNPDGTPRRITNMTYLREVPMLLKHIQEHGGNVLSGAKEMLWNKLMFEPFSELLNNRDYYGFNVFDSNAPFYQQIWQAIKHTYGDQFNPMSISGAKHAAQLSGKEWPSVAGATDKGAILSYLGFGPAPAYVEKSPLQNRIAYLYGEHVAPVSRPEEQGENTEERMAVRQAIMIARRDHDSKGLSQAYVRGKAIGMSQTSMNQVGREATDVYLFSRLPNEDQIAILREADKAERDRYWPKAHAAVKMQIMPALRQMQAIQ